MKTVSIYHRMTAQVNPSTPRPEGQGLLRVNPERRFYTLPSKAKPGAAARVKKGLFH
jgi:hypothetical protein